MRNALRVTTATREYRKSQFERQMLEDDNRCGCPATAAIVENAVKVKSLDKEDSSIIHEGKQDARGHFIGMCEMFSP